MHRTPRAKTCDRCRQEKPATEKYFDPHLRSPDRLKAYFRACSPTVAAERRKRKNELSKAWYHATREKAQESAKKYLERNRSKRLAYMRRWREANKEHIREYGRKYLARKSAKAAEGAP